MRGSTFRVFVRFVAQSLTHGSEVAGQRGAWVDLVAAVLLAYYPPASVICVAKGYRQ